MFLDGGWGARKVVLTTARISGRSPNGVPSQASRTALLRRACHGARRRKTRGLLHLKPPHRRYHTAHSCHLDHFLLAPPTTKFFIIRAESRQPSRYHQGGDCSLKAPAARSRRGLVQKRGGGGSDPRRSIFGRASAASSSESARSSPGEPTPLCPVRCCCRCGAWRKGSESRERRGETNHTILPPGLH